MLRCEDGRGREKLVSTGRQRRQLPLIAI